MPGAAASDRLTRSASCIASGSTSRTMTPGDPPVTGPTSCAAPLPSRSWALGAVARLLTLMVEHLANEAPRLLQGVGGLGEERPEHLEDVRIGRVELDARIDPAPGRVRGQLPSLAQREIAGRGLDQQRRETGQIGGQRAEDGVLRRVAVEVGAIATAGRRDGLGRRRGGEDRLAREV